MARETRSSLMPPMLALVGSLLLAVPLACIPAERITDPNASANAGDETAASNEQLAPIIDAATPLTLAEIESLLAEGEDRVVIVLVNPEPSAADPVTPVDPPQLPPPSAFVGEVRMYAGGYEDPGEGWMVCDGRELLRGEYPLLFQTIGVHFGAGNGSTTFNLPDFRDRSPMGASTGDPANEPMTTVQGQIAAFGGSAEHVLTAAEMPVHDHELIHSHEVATSGSTTIGSGVLITGNPLGGTGTLQTISQSADRTTFAGGGAPHNIVHPYFAVTYVIHVGEPVSP